MNENDKRMMTRLIQDKGKTFEVMIDNDCIIVYSNSDEEFRYGFTEFGQELLIEVFKYLGINAEGA
jgi:hypothetical protein